MFVEENKMQIYRLRDKINFELVMLFEKEITSNIVVM
jgi:hypothetical protein